MRGKQLAIPFLVKYNKIKEEKPNAEIVNDPGSRIYFAG